MKKCTRCEGRFELDKFKKNDSWCKRCSNGQIARRRAAMAEMDQLRASGSQSINYLLRFPLDPGLHKIGYDSNWPKRLQNHARDLHIRVEDIEVLGIVSGYKAMEQYLRDLIHGLTIPGRLDWFRTSHVPRNLSNVFLKHGSYEIRRQLIELPDSSRYWHVSSVQLPAGAIVVKYE